MLCIRKASGDRICQNWESLEVAKNEMFLSPKVATFGNFQTCSKLPIPGPETYLEALSSHCSRVNITNTTWYRLVVEPVVEGCDASCQVNITLAYAADGTIIDQCNLVAIAITILSSAPVVIGGMAVGVEGLMGCLELMVNFNSLNLEGIVDDITIHTNDCGLCDILPCFNGGLCVPLNDYEFNCSCVDPYFGDFCVVITVM